MISCRTTLVLILGAHLILFIAPVTAKNVVCYFHNWAQYRPGVGRMMATDINPYLCTHLIFAFSQLNGNKIVAYEVNDEGSSGQWRQFIDLKKVNPQLKTLLAVGGYNHGSQRFMTMSSNPSNRAEFITTSINLLRYYGFDGLDIDWEYPGDSAGGYGQFVDLIKETKAAFEREATISGQSRLLLTAAVSAGITTAGKSYDVTALNTYLDIVNVMTYDYHGLWESYTGLSAPMFSFDDMNVGSTISWYLQQGLRSTKIHLGMAFFGRSWKLASTSNTAVGAPALSAGNAGLYTRTAGILAYYEICEMLSYTNVIKNTDQVGYQKYAYSGDQWFSYDDKDTLGVKIDYLLNVNLGGVMVWSLPEDDPTGLLCNQGGAFPLTTYVSGRIKDVTDQPNESTLSYTSTVSSTTLSTSSTTSTTTSSTSTTATPPSATATISTFTNSKLIFTCPSTYGFFPSPTDCVVYYVCNSGIAIAMVRCPTGTLYNSYTKKCENKETTTFVCPVV